MKKMWSSGPLSRPGAPEDMASSGDGSELFSLKELRAKEASAAAALVNERDKRDEEDNSGIIDLKALMVEAEREQKAKADEQALRVSQHIGVYPFGSPSSSPPPSPSPSITPLAAAMPVALVDPTPALTPSSSMTRVRVWGGVLAGVIAGAGAMAGASMSDRGTSPEPLRVAQFALAPSVVQRASAPVTAQASAAEQASSARRAAQGKSVESPEGIGTTARPPKIGLHVSRAPVMNRTPTVPKPDPTQAPQANPKPSSSDPCHGDLMCAMQRAIKNQNK